MEITAKGKIKETRLNSKKSLNREQRFNMWVFATVPKISDLNLKFLFRYLNHGNHSWEAVLENRDYLHWMVQRKEIQDS